MQVYLEVGPGRTFGLWECELKKIKVKLANQNELTGTGYVHEYMLMEAGWNGLPEEKKYGLCDDNLVVTFPHCIMPDGSVAKFALFPNEIIFAGSTN